MKTYDFDKIIDRRGTGAVKTDVLKSVFGKEDLQALWVADMDFETPDFIIDALKERMEHQDLYIGRQDTLCFRKWNQLGKSRNRTEFQYIDSCLQE